MLDVKFVRSDDADIAYHTVGRGDTAMVWVQGAFTHLEMTWAFPPFRRYCESLGEFVRLILFDKRGMGMSSRHAGAAPWDRRMADIGAVMDAEGIEQAALLGESEGGPLSLLFAAAHPERVSHLILQGSEVRERNDDEWQWGDATEAEFEANYSLVHEIWGRETQLVPWLFGDEVADAEWIREAILRIQRNACSPSEWEAFGRMAFDIDVREMLPAVRVPTLILHSTGDRMVDVENGRFLARMIPDARLVERDSTAHLPWLEPDAVMSQIRDFVSGTVAPRRSKRVLTTVLFTDVVGSTPLAAQLGDEHWRSLLETHHAMVRDEFRHFGGTEVASAGDGFVARFAGPADALACARSIVDLAGRDGLPVRAGLHTGEVELIGDDIAGLAVHIGARIGGMAEGGEILVSGSVRDISAGSSLSFSDRGEQALRGVPGKWRVYAVAPPGAGDSHARPS